jgi:transcriptional regulator with XRE-family HTH domain
VAIRDDIQARRWLVGVELVNYRQREAVKQAAVAKAIGVSPGLISHFEQGKYLPDGPQIRGIMAACGASPEETTRLVEFANQAGEARSWLTRWDGVIAPFTRRFLGCEGFASREFIYAPLVLPALVQTERYAAAMTAPSARVRSDQERPLVELRMARQARLRDGDLHLTAVIEEAVLDRPAGNAETMREQFQRLLELAKQSNVDVLIIPTSVGRHDGLEGRFTTLQFDTSDGGRQVGPIAYIEVPGDAVYKTTQDQVAAYTDSSNLIVSTALPQSASREAIEVRLAG